MERAPKNYLYHMEPEDMRPDEEGRKILYPLNTLKELHPDLYAKEIAKYEERPHVVEQFIPTLQAAWNDVVHLTAVNPKELKRALIEAGLQPHERRFYQIDPEMLDPQRTTIYLYQEKEDKPLKPEHFVEYKSGSLAQHTSIPAATREYYARVAAEGKKPKLFVGIPHILYKGSIDVSKLNIITA